MTARTLTLGSRTYPLVLPSLRDPRLHVAAVTLTVHALGQVGLGFHLSVPQILAAILTCAIIEVILTFRRTRAIVWPASAMLTGSGVALILRVVGMPAHEPWSLEAWPLFAAVAGFSLLTKYVIRYGGTHVFNPSNVGLVVAFLVLGNSRVEPLDFWWAPPNVWMLTAYAVIVGGGALITRRLGLLEMAIAFWLALAAGVGVLAASGHCMTANWAFAPVCDGDFWRVIVTSPEVLVFLFFMITDPRTVPRGRVARIVFALLVAASSTLLMAPQVDEYGTKVAVLASLVIACAVRPWLERVLPAPGSAADDPRVFLGRLLGRVPAAGVVGAGKEAGSGAAFGGALAAVATETGGRAVVGGRAVAGGAVEAGGGDLMAGAESSATASGRAPHTSPVRVVARAGLIGLALVAGGASIVAAGTPARGVVAIDATRALQDIPTAIDPSTLPSITVAQEVIDFDHELAGRGIEPVVVTLAENLELENLALLRRDEGLLAAVSHGDRLDEMVARLRESVATGRTVVHHYRFDRIDVSLVVPFGRQTGLSLGFLGRGTVVRETYDAKGALLDRESVPFEELFVLRRATGGRWLNVAVLPPPGR